MEGRTVRLTGQDSRRGTFVQRFACDRRPQDRRVVGAAEAPRRRAGQVPRVRLAAQRVRGDGLRVRLLRRPAGRARAVGGAVRRLRQRRADDHRRVHRLGPGQVDAEVRASPCSSRTATRARDRTTPRRGSSGSCSWRPRTPSRSPSRRPRRATSTCCAATRWASGTARCDRGDAEVDAAEQAGHLACRTTSPAAPWRPVLSDPLDHRPAHGRRVLLCSGKVRWDLHPARAERPDGEVAIIPVERLYPLPAQEIAAELAQLPERHRDHAGCRTSRPTRAPGRSWP